MTTTQEVLDAAKKLGSLINEHEAAQRMQQAVERIQQDSEAQRLLNDYNRQVQTIAEKESQGKPIEVEDKRALEKLQNQIASNPTLRQFQIAQMHYVDLMRQVDEAIAGKAPQAAAGAQAAPPPGAGGGAGGPAGGGQPGGLVF